MIRPEFQAGAREVWNAVLPLLAETDEQSKEIINPDDRLWLQAEPALEASEERARWAAREPC